MPSGWIGRRRRARAIETAGRIGVAPLLALAILVAVPRPAVAEWQIKPFFGATFGGNTTFIDLEQAVGNAHFTYGVSGVWLGEVIGADVDFGRSPGFFQSGDRAQPLLLESNVTTFTGNVVVALPGRIARYTLRPYFVGGAGLMRARQDPLGAGGLALARTLPAMDLGGGVTGFLTDRIGLSWEARYFRSSSGGTEGVSLAPEQLSFWRASMAVAVRL